jgi:SNF2 family DNA or RNA helicase
VHWKIPANPKDSLDEAQAIKNYKSHTSVACRGLEARHRWALSGTPIQNAVQELYPYFNFLKVKHIGTFKIFFANFIGTDKKPSLLGIERLNQLLARFMIRRTHADKVMGHRLVTLPHASQQIRWCTFNDVERSIYEIVRARMIKRINRLSRSKKLDANYSHVLTMLLRLRQLTGHLLMLQGPMQDLLEIEDHEKIVELAQIEGHANRLPLRAMQIKRLRELIAKGALHNDQHHPARTNFPGVQDNYRRNDSFVETEEGRHDSGSELVRDRDNIGRIHGLQYNFLKYLKTLRAGANMTELRDRTTCVSCNDRAEDPMVTSCYHVYCSECIEAVMNDAALEYQDQARCKECGIKFDDVKACDNFDLDQMDENLDIGDTSDTDTELLKKNRSRKKKKKDQKRKDEDWIDQEGVNILPSAKTLGIKAQILNWISENPNVKVIIFTQFIDMIRILSKVCQAERWVHTTYHGGRSQEARKQAIKHFQLNPEIRVLLASLKAGGIGLNLTMAQKVIVVDPWWNNAVEQQAFCRVFRIGQDQETSLTRFAVENTVDQNMIEMQQRKQAEIDQVMGEKPRK